MHTCESYLFSWDYVTLAITGYSSKDIWSAGDLIYKTDALSNAPLSDETVQFHPKPFHNREKERQSTTKVRSTRRFFKFDAGLKTLLLYWFQTFQKIINEMMNFLSYT